MSVKPKIFGIFNLFDLIIILILILAVLAIFLVRTGTHTTSPQITQQTQEIEFDVVIRGEKVSKDSIIFEPGEKCFITIRNVPYTKLEIVKSEQTPWKVAIPDPQNPGSAIAVKDPSAPYTKNFLVTLKDKAVVTSDGTVVGGNKIKMGLPILLEGFDYRFGGIVSDIRIQKEEQPQ